MYIDFFSLTEKPFSITPDPAFLFLSKRHEEALAHLIYGVTDSGGFIQLTGEVGTGKTTIIRSLFEQMPENVQIALILNPRLSVNEFLRSICEELNLELGSDASNKDCVDVLNPHLLTAYAQGRKVVLLVDEAQNLSVDVLEQIRLLTNLETHKDKLLQIILVGQPELQTLLQRQDLRQLAQRITARYYLKPLNKQEARAYIKHRLSVAGAKYPIFKPVAENLIFRASKGIPRLINVVCDRALLGAFSQQIPAVDAGIARNAISEVLGDASVSMNQERSHLRRRSSLLPWAWIPAVLLLAFITWQLPLTKKWLDRSNTPQAQVQSIGVAENSESRDQLSIIEPQLNQQSLNTIKIVENKNQAAEANVVLIDAPEFISLKTLLIKQAEHTTAERAFNQLLVLWGRSRFYEHSNACENLKVLGLRCLLQKGQWENIIRLNRPVILEMRDEQSTPHQLLVSSVDNENVIIKLDSGLFTVPLSEVLTMWQGEYLAFWQPERLDASSLSFGMRSDSVVWLRDQLSYLGLLVEGSDRRALFDIKVLDAVKKFQASQAIRADGIVGPETFLMLNNALKLSGRPTLNKEN